MGKVYTGASTSIDGYVSGPDNSGFDKLFRWYEAGDVAFTVPTGTMTVHLTPNSAAHYGGLIQMTGALVVGRKLYDLTNGWGGQHPMGVHTVVLTHRPLEDTEHFTFCGDGIEKAIELAQAKAGDKGVGLNSGEVARQALDAGLLDEIYLDLVPVILGGGTPFFAPGNGYQLEGPISVLESTSVTHLRYRVKYEAQ